ncbi:hypothetical protein HHL09_14650 [Luteolibacter luteus]|uniref:SGNH hydrolase-type esterase domain-containing protein n=2 Tax=Luteolibacter luteus TaxID=2728835 RepID=A0A858RKF0_9BACT|nr:hypothetical protein HHL09_14650 [Luteolibacter luteus]
MTWGYWADYPLLRRSYPFQLERLLGPGFSLRNYGFNGASAGRYPGEEYRAYLNSGEQVGILKWKPDVVISGLGINDCLPAFSDPVKFEQGYRELAAAWRSSGKNPSIWIWNRLSPDFRGPRGVPAFPGNVFPNVTVFTEDDNGIAANRPAIQNRMDQFAPSAGFGTIDAYSQLATHPEWGGEGLHFVEPGLKRLAEIIYCRAWETRAKSMLPKLTEIVPLPGAGSPNDDTGTKRPWVEIYNPYEGGLCLDGLSLDTGAGTPRYEFENSTVLWPKERRLIFLSGHNRKDPTRTLHTNFGVDYESGQLRLVGRDGLMVQSAGWRDWTASGSFGLQDPQTTEAVGTSSPHSRLVTSTPPENWQQPSYSGSWDSGTGGTGYELATKAEDQFTKRWNCSQAPSGIWGLYSYGKGTWTAQGDGTYQATGTGLMGSPFAWTQSDDVSWTFETRLRINGTQSGTNRGFVIKGGTRGAGGGYGTIFIQSDKVRYGQPYDQGFTLSSESNSDDFHVFRFAYHAPTRRFFVWRDGVQITSLTGGRFSDASRQNWLVWGSYDASSSQDVTIDYASVDLTNAYAPAGSNESSNIGAGETKPMANDYTGVFSEQSTCLVRIPFQGSSQALAGMRMDINFDDGFRAWINGVEVAACNAPASGLTAPLSRDDSRGTAALSFDLSEFASLVKTGENLLAVQVFNAAGSDGRCFVSPKLTLIGQVPEAPRYFASPSPNGTSTSGAPLPAMAWLDSEPPPPAGGVPLALNVDSDGDGRSDLLEYSEGTSINSPDAGPSLEPFAGQVSFLWRSNSQVGWRLMESTDMVEWRPARISGQASVSPSGTPDLNQISQPVSGSGVFYRLAAIEQPTLATWQARYFTSGEISQGTISSSDADPDLDGLPNSVEFALNINPRENSHNSFQISRISRGLRFPDPGVGRGVVWHLDSSRSLQSWETPADVDLHCLVDPLSGRYLLEAGDPGLPGDKGFLRMSFESSAN